MSSSTYGTYPSLDLSDGSIDRMHKHQNERGLDNSQPLVAAAPLSSNHLSPYSQGHSNSVSPTLNNTTTPADSLSAFSEQYQSSDFSEVDADPFFGVDFNENGGTPSFLDDHSTDVDQSSDHSGTSGPQATPPHAQHGNEGHTTYPLSPDPTTPSWHTSSPRPERKSSTGDVDTVFPDLLSPHALPKLPTSIPVNCRLSQVALQSTPDTNRSGHSSEDGMAPNQTSTRPSPSPRVTVSLWGKDQMHHNIDSVYPGDHGDPTTVRPGISSDDNFISSSYQSPSSASRNEQGAWRPNSKTGRRGLAPESRSAGETVSVNELNARRLVNERNQEVKDWISSPDSQITPDSPPAGPAPPPESSDAAGDGISRREIDLGHETENKGLYGQIYYNEDATGALTENDLEIMRQNRLYSDAPMRFKITRKGTIPSIPTTSQAAIEKFERMCKDNESVVSRAATWGTRRRSLPSISDMEEVTSGSFLKKLSISRERKPSVFFRELRGLVRKPSASQLLKRSRSSQDEEGSSDADSPNRKDSHTGLAPPTRSMSWGKKQSMPSLNTALVSMAAGAAAIGTSHARTSSISNAAQVTSPKSPFNLQVRNTLRRPRSKSDLPKSSSADETYPHLVGMWKKSGGPPVAQLAKSSLMTDQDDDDDDEEEEVYDETDQRPDSNKIIDSTPPNFAGFQDQILKMNPKLAEQNAYLVDRIAHQQIVRYKSLLNSKVRHLQFTTTGHCPNDSMCIALGGQATILDVKGDPRGLDPLSTGYDGSDGDLTPLDGAVTAESFPPDIPMPPTNTLPAEFECQLCFQTKKFTKPSDWTKHVHEDVQPFTCTWERCRDPKIFKRKADWVRHENEGHRHLEWWMCDVDDCHHTCYRRDNFLQHLVREHKFPEPKVKTKAAIKRAGGLDPTWQKVEKCHQETRVKPQEEPCRFCGKTFPTWKKLTVHLAKHMENLSLPILRLVARKELEPDTIISPVQGPPPKSFAPLPHLKNEPQPLNSSPPLVSQAPLGHQSSGLAYPNQLQDRYGYQAQSTLHNAVYGWSPGGRMHLNMQGMNAGFHNQAGYSNMPVSAASYVAPSNQFMSISQRHVEQFPPLPMQNPLGLQDPTGSQMYEVMMDPVQGSVSPFSHSPHLGQTGFYSGP